MLSSVCYPRSIPTSRARIQLMVQVFMAYIYPMQNVCTYTHTHTLLVIISQEGPHSALNEEEFFDALEMAYQNDEMEANVS